LHMHMHTNNVNAVGLMPERWQVSQLYILAEGVHNQHCKVSGLGLPS